MTRIDFRLLGPIEVLVDGRSVPLGYAKQRCVLAALVSDAGRLVPVERLVERVWGDRPPVSAYNVIYGHVARLRGTLRRTGAWGGDGPLGHRPGGYLLAADAAAIDLPRFRTLVGRAREATDSHALALLLEALDEWRGPALAGADGPWAERSRLALERERTAARLAACDLRLRLGRTEEAARELTDLAADDPLHEGVAARLVVALHRGGHTAAALDHFARSRRLLVDELGADPGPELRAAHQLVLVGTR
jgi:DNA-binding SARP family transcriptional activator